MARANLRGLIGNLGDTEAPDPQPAVDVPGELSTPPELPKPATKPSTSKASTTRVEVRQSLSRPVPPSVRVDAPGVRFSDFQRKETRLRVDQQDALTEHARRLNRAKGVGGQRVTDNTLIRVAVDLLLSKADYLAGPDEAGLRRSLGLRDAET
jgi:hypothetical protein